MLLLNFLVLTATPNQYPETSNDLLLSNSLTFTTNHFNDRSVSFSTFERDLYISSATVDDSRVNPNQILTFRGTLHYTEINIPPASGKSALRFDGIDDYVEIPNAPSLQITNDLTIEFWVKPFIKEVFQPCVSKSFIHEYEVSVDTREGARKALAYRHGNGTSFEAINFPEFFVDEEAWYHVVVVRDADQKSVTAYKNGRYFGQKNYTINPVTSVNPLFIGRRTSLYLKGVLDEIRIYNCVLSSDEINEHYLGIFKNKAGLVLHLSFDGDAKDRSESGNDGDIQGPTWTDGYANIELKVKLEGVLKQTASLVNSTSGAFVIPLVTAESNVGKYDYTIYTENALENQTVSVIVDRIKITKGGSDRTAVFVGEEQTVWFIAVYEFDNSTFDGTSGMLYMNGSAMEWSVENERWEYKYVPDVPGVKFFSITGVLDVKYGLSVINDVAGVQTITVQQHWYTPILRLFRYPLICIGIIIILFFAVLFRLRILEVKIEKAQNE